MLRFGRHNNWLISILSLLLATNLMAAEYYCEATSKWDGDDLLYSQDQLNKYKFAVKIKEVGDEAILSRCSFQSSAGKVTCDDYPADYIYSDPVVGHKKYYYFRGQFDVQIFSNLFFVENNGRGSIAMGKCKLTRP